MRTEDWLIRIEDKLDRLILEIIEVKVQVAENKANWETHLKRTNLLEDKLEQDKIELKNKVKLEVGAVKEEIQPVITHVKGFRWLGKSLFWLATTLAVFGTSVAAILGWF